MRIGIITIHFPYNYGAMLQAYATRKYLEKLGHEVEIIDYRPYFIDKSYHFYFRNCIFTPRKFIVDILGFRKIDRGSFESFLSHYILKENQNKFKVSLNWDEYDVLITGSDQVWNPQITNRDMIYLLDFAKDSRCKKISYASSIALNNIDEQWKKTLEEKLQKYSDISLREEKEISFLNRVLGREVYQVLDPTFLLDEQEWAEMGRKPCELSDSEEYILMYRLQPSEELDEAILKYKEKHRIKVISIHPFEKKNLVADMSLTEIGPQEFLWLVKNAKCVFTNSFHGTAFSIIFDRPFMTVKHTQTGSRMESLVKLLQMEPFDEGLLLSNENSKRILEQKREESKNWLKMCLSENKGEV